MFLPILKCQTCQQRFTLTDQSCCVHGLYSGVFNVYGTVFGSN